jgi:CheY-like chemotaxis protein
LLHTAPAQTTRPTPTPQTSRLRVTVVEPDLRMASLFRDLLADEASVTVLTGLASINRLADTAPDAIVLGLGAGGEFGTWDLVALIQKHRVLHDTPIILCTLDVAAEMRDGRLAAHRGVQALEMPCDVELIQSIVRATRPTRPTRVTRPVSGANRLPDVCSHGFMTEWTDECRACTPPPDPWSMSADR